MRLAALALSLLAVAGCARPGRPLSSSAATDRRQSIWERCSGAISAMQCGSDRDVIYQSLCMRRIGDRYFATDSVAAAQAIALENGCPETIVGSRYAGEGAHIRGPETRLTWTDHEMRDLLARINMAVASCFAAEHLPVRVSMTIDVHGHVAAHELLTEHTDEEAGCVARVLVSIDVEGAAVREPRTITSRLGEAAAIDAGVTDSALE